MPNAVSFRTKDGITVHGLFTPGKASAAGVPHRALLLLHMMPATKESWRDFQEMSAEAGFSVLAIDLRGHGQSTVGPNGSRLLYKLFSDREHQSKILDVEAAADWLMAEVGIGYGSLGIIGASIGANLAINFAAAHSGLPAAAALSPGWDYHGVTTPDQVRRLRPEQKLLLAASEEDDLSFRTNRDLKGIRPDAEIKEYRGAGHGTSMFEARPELMAELLDWLKDSVPESGK